MRSSAPRSYREAADTDAGSMRLVTTGLRRQFSPSRRAVALLRNRRFADSPLERDGFETSVPGERAYGLNLCLSPYELPFSARRCSVWKARTR
jgi:hypothetical protein